MAKTSANPRTVRTPYVGLRAYTEEEGSLFFGRERETIELARLVDSDTVSILYGVSGIGKSSLLSAGLFHQLRQRDFLLVRVRLDHDESSPPLALQLQRAVHASAAQANVVLPEPRGNESLWEYFHHHDRAEFWTDDHRLLVPLLAIDQFEEFFSLGHESTARRERSADFREQFLALVNNEPPALPATSASFHLSTAATPRFLLILREDFIAQLLPIVDELAERLPGIHRQKLRLLPLATEAARQIIAGPARALGLEPPDDAAASAIVQLAASSAGNGPGGISSGVEPARLALLLSALEAERQARGLPRITADLASLAGEDLFAHFVDVALEGQPHSARIFLEEELVTPDGYRSDATTDQAARFGVGPEMLRRLQERRLLAARPGHPVRYELSHDLLCPPLLRSQAERTRAAVDSKAAAQSRQLRRAWLLSAGFAILAVLSVTTLVWALRQRSEAKKAEGRAIAAQKDADGQKQEKSNALDQANAALKAKEIALNEKDVMRAIANTQATLADENSKLATRAVEAFTGRLVDEVKVLPGTQAEVLRRVLKTVLNVYEGLPAGQATALQVAHTRSRLLCAMSQSSLNRGDPIQAAEQANRAVELLLGVKAPESSSPEAQMALCDAYLTRSEVLERWGAKLSESNSAAAADSFDQANRSLDAAAKIVAARLAATPGKEWLLMSAQCEDGYGDLALNRWNSLKGYVQEKIRAKKRLAEQAPAHYNKAFDIRTQLLAAMPSGTIARDLDPLHRLLATSHNKLGNYYAALLPDAESLPNRNRDAALALEQYDKALKIRSELAHGDQQNTDLQRDLSLSLNNIGKVLFETNQYPQALEYYEQRRQIAERLYKSDPLNVIYQEDFGLALSHIASIYQKPKAGYQHPKAGSLYDPQKAFQLLEQAVQITDGQVEPLLEGLVKACKPANQPDQEKEATKRLTALQKLMPTSAQPSE